MSEQVKDSRRGRFWMDDDVIDHFGAKLGVYGVAVYTMLCRRADKNGKSYPSLRRMAKDLDVSESQVRRELKKLNGLKLIRVERQSRPDGGTASSAFYVLEVPASQAGYEEDVSEEGGVSETGGRVSVRDPKKEDTVKKETSSLTKVREEGESDGSPIPDEKAEEEKPVTERSVSERQKFYIGYLAERLTERELVESKPLSGAYKSRLAGELRNHINAGMRHAAILLVLDKIVHRWSEKRLDFYAAADDQDELGRRRQSKEKTTADREYDEAFRESYDGYESDFTDPDNPGLPLRNPGYEVLDPASGEPKECFENEAHFAMGDLTSIESLPIGEECFWRGRKFRRDEEGQLWSGRKRVAI